VLSSRRGELRSPTNWHSPEFGLLSETDDDRAALSRSLFETSPRHVSIAFLGSANDMVTLRDAARVAGYLTLVRTITWSPTVWSDGDQERYEACFGRNLRRNLRRNVRHLDARGQFRFVVETGGHRLDTLLKEGFRLESLAWKGAKKTAIMSRPQTLQFYSEMADWAAREGILRLFFLHLDGRPFAFAMALEDQNVLYGLKGGYDPDFARYSPGILLLYHTISYAFERRLTRYELLPGTEPYKLALANDSHEISVLRAFAPTPLGYLNRAANRYGRPLARAAGVHRVLSRVRP
jgi:CelD/BcsL family acetyltransferase involved in cellulose biosynthesis